MSGLIATAKPYRIKAAHRRRRKVAAGPSVQRYYDPSIGRFLSVDPVTADGNSGSNFNRYWYANNNPYRFFDPDGRRSKEQHKYQEEVVREKVVQEKQVEVHREKVASQEAIQPVVPEAIALPILRLVKVLATAADAAKVSKADGPYKRPSNATTKEQRASVQGKPCVKCGAETPNQVAGHKKALVEEFHETGKIDYQRMRDVDAVQPECPTCSSREGLEMMRYSREMNATLRP